MIREIIMADRCHITKKKELKKRRYKRMKERENMKTKERDRGEGVRGLSIDACQ